MPKNKFPIPVTYSLLVVLLSMITNNIVESTPLKCPIPHQLKDKLHSDASAIESVSTDYGNIVHFKPSSVLYPSTVQDIQALIKCSYNCSHPFVISARGNGHSVQGQDMARNGVVVDMQQFKKNKKGSGVFVSKSPLYADVGGELLWSDVLNGTLKEGVLPVSWTGYLGLTVGGTLSCAGTSGQTFWFGPQVSNVYEMDVVTGKGELVTCSPNKNSELFYAVLGGLGQFGIITRARIVVEPAKERVRWVRLLYSDFASFMKDQEGIIAINGRNQRNAIGFVMGQLLLANDPAIAAALTSFFPPEDVPKILSLLKEHGIIYGIEIADPYDNCTKNDEDKKVENLIEGLNPLYGMVYQKDVPYVDFLRRIKIPALKNVSSPWLNIFIPKSRMIDFNAGVIKDILLKQKTIPGAQFLVPANKNKWDDRMSVAIPKEDTFYQVSFLFTTGVSDWKRYYEMNDAIMKFCKKADIDYKLYLQRYSKKQQWIKHFGARWATFQKRKYEYDPRHILSPGQRIFN